MEFTPFSNDNVDKRKKYLIHTLEGEDQDRVNDVFRYILEHYVRNEVMDEILDDLYEGWEEEEDWKKICTQY